MSSMGGTPRSRTHRVVVVVAGWAGLVVVVVVAPGRGLVVVVVVGGTAVVAELPLGRTRELGGPVAGADLSRFKNYYVVTDKKDNPVARALEQDLGSRGLMVTTGLDWAMPADAQVIVRFRDRDVELVADARLDRPHDASLPLQRVVLVKVQGETEHANGHESSRLRSLPSVGNRVARPDIAPRNAEIR